MLQKLKIPLSVQVAFLALAVIGLWLGAKPAPATSMQPLGIVQNVSGCESGRLRTADAGQSPMSARSRQVNRSGGCR